MLMIPYGKTHLPFEEGNAAVLRSRIGELRAEQNGADLVRAAMDAPIGSPKLSELAKDKRNCVIIISDHTRPVPSRDILPHMLRELKQGNPEIEIILLVATGCHRAASSAELEAKLGREILNAVQWIADTAAETGESPSVTEELFECGLYTSGMPDPELLIRTSGELRISNFLLWQLAYTEIYCTDVLWPDFNRYEFLRSLLEYQNRNRRFGAV